MFRAAWLTDIHLIFFRDVEQGTFDEEYYDFLEAVRATDAGAILITGDIAEAHVLLAHLEHLDDSWQRPLYFVLGNHDFYRSSIPAVRRQVAELCRRRPRLRYLSECEPLELAPGVGLVGHDGWADGRFGHYLFSTLKISDYQYIEELKPGDADARWPVVKALGDEAAAHIQRVLPAALARFSHVFLLTHIPPFREAALYKGRRADDECAPFFTCKATGDAILEIMSRCSDRKLTVLCGHTHESCEFRPLDNVVVLSGGATYFQPAVARVFEL